MMLSRLAGRSRARLLAALLLALLSELPTKPARAELFPNGMARLSQQLRNFPASIPLSTAYLTPYGVQGSLIRPSYALNSGETITGFSPNDGRVAIASGGGGLVVGSAGSSGTYPSIVDGSSLVALGTSTTYSLTTNQGRTLAAPVVADSGITYGLGTQAGTYAVGASGQAGTIYAGFKASWVYDFTAKTPSQVWYTPWSPANKLWGIKVYSAGPFGGDGQLSVMQDIPWPTWGGYGDYTRGVPYAWGNETVDSTNGVTLQIRHASTAEQAMFQGSGRYNAASMLSFMRAIQFYPGAPGTGDVMYEFKFRYGTASVGAGHPTLWTHSTTPPDSGSQQQINFENGAFNETFSGGSLASDSPGGFLSDNHKTGLFGTGHFTPDTLFHYLDVIDSSDHQQGIIALLDGQLIDIGRFSGGAIAELSSLLATMHDVANGDSESAWIAAPSGMNMQIQRVSTFIRSSAVHLAPLTTISDVQIANGGSASISIPSCTTLYGITCALDIRNVMSDEFEPGGSHAATYTRFASGVSADAGSLAGTGGTLTAAPTDGRAGRLNFIITPVASSTVAGDTVEPAIFSVSVGPKETGSTVYYVPGSAFSWDAYASVDAGNLVSDGIGATKTVNISGTLPTWASYSQRTYNVGTGLTSGTGLVTGTAGSSDTASYPLTVSGQNSLGQTYSATVTIMKQPIPVASYTADFTTYAVGNLETVDTHFTRIDGVAGGFATATTSSVTGLKDVATSANATAYQGPLLNTSTIGYYIQGKWAIAGQGYPLALRMKDSSNYLGLQYASGKINVGKVVGGVVTVVASYTTTLASTDVVELDDYSEVPSGDARYGTISVKVNGTVIAPTTGSFTVSTWSGSALSTLTSRYPGMAARNGADTYRSLTYWQAGVL